MTYNPPISSDTILSLNPYDSSVSVTSVIDLHAAALIKFNPQQSFLRTSTCFIPPNKIFCFGNSEGRVYVGKTVIIEDDQAKVMKEGTACLNSGSVYLNGYVYLFGGNNNNGILPLCEKFSILRNNWSKLAMLVTPMINCVCIEFCGKILYSGNSNRVYLYDVYLNSHIVVINAHSLTSYSAIGMKRLILSKVKEKFMKVIKEILFIEALLAIQHPNLLIAIILG
ncbi:unnamed protein product [Blepharisma stoltei]|uniref:Uncharacterized protein n=1 Tax=Blepharisma stoltei TaxID=1481888 RepID=A0AAU9JDP9_9CILI|nr:unnamed protein product [Blepharisma stoltei]